MNDDSMTVNDQREFGYTNKITKAAPWEPHEAVNGGITSDAKANTRDQLRRNG